MSKAIDHYGPRSGRMMREDDSVINTASILAPVPGGDNETITVSSTVESLDPPDGAIGAAITVEDAAIRFWRNGVDPTATDGHKISAGGEFLLQSAEEIAGFRAIREGDTDAVIQVSYSVDEVSDDED